MKIWIFFLFILFTAIPFVLSENFNINHNNSGGNLPQEICDDGVDNNGDALIDCTDPQCSPVSCNVCKRPECNLLTFEWECVNSPPTEVCGMTNCDIFDSSCRDYINIPRNCDGYGQCIEIECNEFSSLPLNTQCDITICPTSSCNGNTAIIYPEICVNLCSDYGICGDCECAAEEISCNSSSVCYDGACVSCPEGFANCDENPSNGCETNMHMDDTNCGACNIVCPAGKECIRGSCKSIEPCNEVFCGNNSACFSGNCICESGYMDCDGKQSTGCEASIIQDNNNCGVCGLKCEDNNVCENGICIQTSPEINVTCIPNNEIECIPKINNVICDKIRGRKICNQNGTGYGQCISEIDIECCPEDSRECDNMYGCQGVQKCIGDKWSTCEIRQNICVPEEIEICKPKINNTECPTLRGVKTCDSCGSSYSVCQIPLNVECCPGEKEYCNIGECDGNRICDSSGIWGVCMRTNTSCGTCNDKKECKINEVCINDKCEILICNECEKPENHICITRTGGICCNNKWNEGFEKCELDKLEELEQIINTTDNETAEIFSEKAKESHEEGIMKKAEAEALIATGIIKINEAEQEKREIQAAKDFLTKALDYYEDGNYDLAKLNMLQAIEIASGSKFVIDPVFVNFMFFLAILSGFLFILRQYFKFKEKRTYSDIPSV